MSDIMQLSFYMGLNCNLRCKYCNLEKDGSNSIIINSLEDFERTINEIKQQFPNKRIVKILLSGGEPTLFEEEVTRILNKYHSEYNFFIITNGVLFDTIKKIESSFDNVRFLVSYDGHINDRGFDSFEVLKYLYSINKLESISMTISNSSYKYLYETLKEIEKEFPGMIDKENESEGYRGLEINVVRKEAEYYNFDYDELYTVLQKVYKKFPRISIFSKKNLKTCKNFWNFDEDLMCTHNGGFLLKKGCYERFDYSTLNKIIDNYDSKCKECNSSACFGRICPVALEVIKLEKDKEHPYCNIMKVIDKVMKNVEDYNFFLGKLKEARFQELILTDSCNLNCKYCFQKDFHSNNVMSKETIKSFFNNILLNSGNGKTIISLFGGEPIQNKTLDIRYYILELINNYKLNDKVILYVTSNTYNINDKEIEWINKAKETTNNNLYWQTSLDGLKEYNDQNRVTLNNKGTFDIVIKNLKIVSDLIGKDRTSINTVLTESNIEGLADWCKYLEEELLYKYIFNVTFRIDQSKSDSISLSERLKIQKAYTKVADYFKQGLISHKLVKNVFNEKVASYEDDITEQKDEFSSCGMCNNMLVVNYNGDIVPCHIFENDEKNYNDIVITNVNNMKFNNDIRKIYQTFGSIDKQYSEDKNKYCYQCPLKLSCTRCKYEHYVVNGDVSKTLKYTCQYTHHRSDIFTETELREYFKPLTENEKEEIRVEIININNIIESGNITKEEEVELVNNLFYLQKIIEDKTWYI